MSDFEPNLKQVHIQTTEKPVAVTVFGVLNIVVGCYYLVRVSPGSYNIIGEVLKNPEKITGSGIIFLLLLAVGLGLSIWLLVLGVGLLTMKRWSRRGSIMYARIQIVLIAVIIATLVISLSIGWTTLPKDGLGAFIISMCKGLLGKLIYPVLLLIFMQARRIRQAFFAIGG
jgi:membrane-associated HD superfamily phosphohydrolase